MSSMPLHVPQPAPAAATAPPVTRAPKPAEVDQAMTALVAARYRKPEQFLRRLREREADVLPLLRRYGFTGGAGALSDEAYLARFDAAVQAWMLESAMRRLAEPIGPEEMARMEVRANEVILDALPDGTGYIGTRRNFERAYAYQRQQRSLRTLGNITGGIFGTIGYIAGGDQGSDLGAIADQVGGAFAQMRQTRQAFRDMPSAVSPRDVPAQYGPAVPGRTTTPPKTPAAPVAPAVVTPAPTAPVAAAPVPVPAAPALVAAKPVPPPVPVRPFSERVHYGDLENGRPTGVIGELHPRDLRTGTRTGDVYPPGLQRGELDPLGARRGHLLGNLFGGSGRDVRNLAWMHKTVNNSHFKTEFENPVRAALERGETVRFGVRPLYRPGEAAPFAVEVWAESATMKIAPKSVPTPGLSDVPMPE
ncbi:DNA/RNA non-specific endonuclease [Actinoplanes sp. LDG1-06]|uniref:DNA/RNA non-specific endonuclease n=1 Tax=Paractinoplanes ovalisporus TaxID=2810368 RepID=A0ABS2A2D9_9ACTN|nr:DNA/RNA non-specific endonuclease [Actinoplanes ovalisporus]MBM2614004.1 DNA/RNA non-specific endonuclease [Actinoplanes ovalisporus]